MAKSISELIVPEEVVMSKIYYINDIQMIFTALKELLTPPEQAIRRRIGFRRQEEEE